MASATADKLEKVARMVAARAFVRERSRELEREARDHAATVELPDDLAACVWAVLAEHSEMAWEQAVEHTMQR